MPARRCVVPTLLALALLSRPGLADEVTASTDSPEPQAAVADTGAGATRLTAPAGTELVFEMLQTVDSKSNQRGDRFQLRLAEPLRIDGKLLIPAGALAAGEVVHADRAKAGGQAGELILAARYLEWDGRQLALGGFRAGVGRDRTNSAMGVAIAAGIAGFLVRGGQIEVPTGSLISAKLRAATELAVLAEPATPEAPATNATPAIPEASATTAIREASATPATPETNAPPATQEVTNNNPGEHQQ